jgi:hypothetical protein
MKLNIKGNALAYLLGVPISIANARYTLTGKLTSFDNIILDEDTHLVKSILQGKILSKTTNANTKLAFESEGENENTQLEHNLDNPCYIYFAEDSGVNVKFAHFHDAYPLQVAPEHIFFWPGINKSNFTVQLDSNVELSQENTAVYCGDLGDILGEHTIEGERSESIRLGSFPASPFDLKHEGYFKLTKPVHKGCHVELHFPLGHAPSDFKFANDDLNHLIKVEKDHNDRSIIMTGFDEISKFEQENNVKVISNQNVYFDLEYSSFDQIAYSYNVVAQVMCEQSDGKWNLDQSELIELEEREERIKKQQAQNADKKNKRKSPKPRKATMEEMEKAILKN